MTVTNWIHWEHWGRHISERKILSDINIPFTPTFKSHVELRIMIKQATDIWNFKTFVRMWDRTRIKWTVLITMILAQNILSFFLIQKEQTCHYWPAKSSSIWTMYSVQDNKIKLHTYHGRPMVGNHCHRYLREEVIDAICNSIRIISNYITHKGSVNKLAFEICSKFKSINKIYAAVHRSISHCKKIMPEEI